jgi:EmrB/QacA subfamily drug resistance transporter
MVAMTQMTSPTTTPAPMGVEMDQANAAWAARVVGDPPGLAAAAARPRAATAETPRGATATIAVACLAVVMLMLDISVINTALSDIAAGLSAGLGGLQWVVDAYTLPLAATVLTFGALADRHGRRRLFAGGLVVFTLASAGCALASSIDVLVATRAVQGLGAAVLFATGLALIAQVSPTPELRAKALAAFGASIGAAFALGPFVGGGLTELLGWRAIFAINVPIGIAALVITLRNVGEGRDEHARAVDWPGQVALIGGMFLLVLGLLRGNEDGWGSSSIVAILGAAATLLVGFAVIQLRSSRPMLPLGLLRRREFAAPQVAVATISASFFALFLYVTLYLQTVLGLSPIETGLVYLPATVLMFIVSGASATLEGKVSPGVLTVAGLGFVALGLALLLFAQADSSWLVVMPGFLVCCLGSGLFNPAASALALNALPEHQSGLASGANDLFRQTGIAVGIAALGTLVPAHAALGGDPQAYVNGFHHAILAGTVLAGVGTVATALLVRSRRTA